MNQTKVDKLLLKLVENRISEAESKELLDWLKSEENLDYFNEFVEINHYINAKKSFRRKDELFDQIKNTRSKRNYNKVLKYAAVIVGLAVATFVFKDKIITLEEPSTPVAPTIVNNEIQPGKTLLFLLWKMEIVLPWAKGLITKHRI